MAFFILVNGELFSLKAATIVDDLSEEAVRKEEIEALALIFAERFAGLTLDTLLLQGLSNTLMLAVLLAAWRVGLKVALIRADPFFSNFKKSKALLGKHLHIFYDASSEEICADDGMKCSSLEIWIQENDIEKLPETPFFWNESAVSLIFFTSGSTGIPKAVCHSLPSLIRSARTFKAHFDITPEDRILSFAELHTNTGLRTLALALLDNISVKFIRKHKGTQSHELAAIKGTTIVICGPYMVEVMLCMKEMLKPILHHRLRVLSLGAHLPLKIINQFFEAYRVPVLNFYGLTETFGFALADKVRNVTEYLPPPCEDVIVSLSAVPGDNKLFYLELESPNLFLGYLGEKLEKKKFFNTQDLVMLCESGQLKFMGRATGASKSKNGEWIFPLQLETWIRSFEAVEDVIVKVNPPLTAVSLLSIFMTTKEENFSQLKNKMTEEIIKFFGHDYQSISWYRADIQRTVEGKVDNIFVKREDGYAQQFL